jgi:endonuclease G
MRAFLQRTVLGATVLLILVSPVRGAEGDEHILLGNPSNATANKDKPNNYLIKRKEYVLAGNNAHGTPNWVSWQLSKRWLGRTRRANPFAPDPLLPRGFFVVRPTDYRAGGFDRGHMCPAADRVERRFSSCCYFRRNSSLSAFSRNFTSRTS